MQLRLLHNNDMLDWIPVSLHKALPVWKLFILTALSTNCLMETSGKTASFWLYSLFVLFLRPPAENWQSQDKRLLDPLTFPALQICCAARPTARADEYLCGCLLREDARLSERGWQLMTNMWTVSTLVVCLCLNPQFFFLFLSLINPLEVDVFVCGKRGGSGQSHPRHRSKPLHVESRTAKKIKAI